MTENDTEIRIGGNIGNKARDQILLIVCRHDILGG